MWLGTVERGDGQAASQRRMHPSVEGPVCVHLRPFSSPKSPGHIISGTLSSEIVPLVCGTCEKRPRLALLLRGAAFSNV